MKLRRAKRRFAFFVFAAICFGVVGLWSGWTGLMDGHITVNRKLQNAFVAYASGPNQAEFEFEVRLRILFGALFAILGVVVATLFWLGSPERRARMLEAANGEFARGQSTKRAPTWLFWVVVGVLCCLVVYAAAGT